MLAHDNLIPFTPRQTDAMQAATSKPARGGKRAPLPRLTITIPNYHKHQGQLKQGVQRQWVRINRNAPNDLRVMACRLEARAVFFSLIMICDEGKLVGFTAAQVAKALRSDYRTVANAIKQLAEVGLILVEEESANAEQAESKRVSSDFQVEVKQGSSRRQVEALEELANDAGSSALQTDSTDIQRETPLPPAGEAEICAWVSTSDGKPFPITVAKVAEWQATYPHLDVATEVKSAAQWTRDSPKQPTYRGATKFIGNWLRRARPEKTQQRNKAHQEIDEAMAIWKEAGVDW